MTWTRIPKWKTSKHLLTLATSIFSYIYSQCQFVILNIQLISTTLIFPFIQTHACRLSIVKTCTLESHHIRTFFTYLYNQNVNDLGLLNNLLWFIIIFLQRLLLLHTHQLDKFCVVLWPTLHWIAQPKRINMGSIILPPWVGLDCKSLMLRVEANNPKVKVCLETRKWAPNYCIISQSLKMSETRWLFTSNATPSITMIISNDRSTPT